MDFINQHKKPLVYGLIGLLAVWALWTGLKPASVPAYTAIKQDYTPSLLLSGEIIAAGQATLSSLGTGQVTECPVDKGDKVVKGQLLVQIDDTQARLDRDKAAAAVQLAQLQLQKAATLSLDEARASSVQADMNLDKAQREYDRTKILAEAGAVSQAEMEQAERNLKTNQELARSARTTMESLQQGGTNISILQAELEQKQLDLTQKEILLTQLKIVAPTDGELLDLYVNPGELVSVGTQVALFVGGEELRIKIQPDQRYTSLAVTGNQAQVWITNQADAKWNAQVVHTDPVGNAEQGSFTAELEFTDPPPPLYPGQLLSVQLFGPAQAGAILIPDKYLAVLDGQNGVWLAVNNRAHFIPLQIGIRTTDGVVINQGLGENDKVLLPDGRKENERVSPQSIKV